MRKALDTMRRQSRQKRGGGRVLGESALLGGDGSDGDAVVEVLGREPSPGEVAGFAEAYARFLERLDDPTLRQIAQRRLEGHSSAEIAAELNVSSKTVDRKLQLIRAIWSRDQGE